MALEQGNIPEAAKGLVRALLNVDPMKRPTAKKVLTHPWLCQCVYGGVVVRRKGASPLAMRSPAKGAVCKPTPSKAVPGILPPAACCPSPQCTPTRNRSKPVSPRHQPSGGWSQQSQMASSIRCRQPECKQGQDWPGEHIACPPQSMEPPARAMALITGSA